MGIRKQVYDLTPEDLERFPVWEFALDEECVEGQDEATVRPYSFTSPVDPSEGMLIVRADFSLADGTRMGGYLTPPLPALDLLSPDLPPVATIQPVILSESGQVMFWYGMFVPGSEAISLLYSRLGRSAGETFPIRFESSVEILGGPVQGTLNGLLYFEYEKSGLFRGKRRIVKEIR